MNVSGSADLYDVILDRLTDPGTVELVRRALAQHVVLDTWMNGEREEAVDPEAEEIVSAASEDLTRQALAERALFPNHPMPEGYVRSAFHDLLCGTTLYLAQRRKGSRNVDAAIAQEAVGIVRDFIEQAGLYATGSYYFLISAHEDLNAIHYFKRMKREDFLLGTLHRPWSDMMLTHQMELYQAAGLVTQTFTGEGEMLELTGGGEEILRHIWSVLEEAGEFEWRSNTQRWVIFNETEYDKVFGTVFPDLAARTRDFIEGLEIPPGARVLEIGAGTGRATLDLGLAARVAAAGGTLVALEPSGALIKTLRRKAEEGNVPNLEIIQGVAETLPFSPNTFDLVVSVLVLHFTDLDQAVAEMVRVAKPGGEIATMAPLESNVFSIIPMVALWFRPLQALADYIGVPLGERHGVVPGATERALRAFGMLEGHTSTRNVQVSATDHRSFLHMVLKGAAFYQNILSRLPFVERWKIIRHLEDTGPQLVEATSPEEQQAMFRVEVVSGRLPVVASVASQERSNPSLLV